MPRNHTGKRWRRLSPSWPARVSAAAQYSAALFHAEILLARGRADEAIELLEKTPPLPQPTFNNMSFGLVAYNTPFLKDVLARAYVKKGNLDKAIAEYERLTTFDPKSDEHFLIHPKSITGWDCVYEQKGLKGQGGRALPQVPRVVERRRPGLPEVADATKRLAALS